MDNKNIFTKQELIDYLVFAEGYIEDKFYPNNCRCNDCAMISNSILAIKETIKILKRSNKK